MNLPTIIVSAIIAAIFVVIVISEIKKKKSGKGCGCGCSGCAMADSCHNKQ